VTHEANDYKNRLLELTKKILIENEYSQKNFTNIFQIIKTCYLKLEFLI
jgi:hypothetical protein